MVTCFSHHVVVLCGGMHMLAPKEHNRPPEQDEYFNEPPSGTLNPSLTPYLALQAHGCAWNPPSMSIWSQPAALYSLAAVAHQALIDDQQILAGWVYRFDAYRLPRWPFVNYYYKDIKYTKKSIKNKAHN